MRALQLLDGERGVAVRHLKRGMPHLTQGIERAAADR